MPNARRLCAGGVFEAVNVQLTTNRAKTAWVFANLILFSKKQAVFCDNRSRKLHFYHLTPSCTKPFVAGSFVVFSVIFASNEFEENLLSSPVPLF